jgi:hypothetical protein
MDFYFTDPRVADFADVDGNSLDDDLVFGTAEVRVIPEPASLGLAAAGAGLLALARLRRRRNMR